MMKIQRWMFAVVFFTTAAAYADISVNFTRSGTNVNEQITASTQAGVFSRVNWNNTTAGAGGTLAALNDASGTPTTAAVSWSCATVWQDNATTADATAGVGDAQLARGYLDDGSPGMNFSVTEIPYSTYTAVLYLSTGDNSGTYLPFNVNGADYSTSGTKHTYRNPNWDASNTIIVEGLSGDLTVVGKVRSGPARGSLCGFQIIEESPTAKPTIFSFSTSSTNVAAGSTVTLSWMTYNASTLSIAPGVGTVTGTNSAQVVVNADTTYTLTASNSNGSTTQTVAITMKETMGLVAHWNFEEGSGSNTVEQVRDAAITISNATWAVGGAPHSTGALAFTNGGRLETGLNATDLGIAGSNAKTIVAWINTTTTVQDAFLGYSPVNGGGAGTELRFLVNGNSGDTTGKLRMEVSGGGFEFGSGFNDGAWHMVAFVINAGDGINDVDVYADGVYTTRSLGGTTINTVGAVVNIPLNGNGFVLGSDGNAGRHFSGQLDDVAIYDKALTETELNNILQYGVSPVAPPVRVEDLAIVGPVSSGTGMVLEWTADKGKGYTVQTNSNLLGGNWGAFLSIPKGSGGMVSVTNSVAAERTFYRIISE